MDVRGSEKQVIDEYTLTYEDKMIVFIHANEEICAGLKQLVLSLNKVGKEMSSFRDQIMESTKEII